MAERLMADVNAAHKYVVNEAFSVRRLALLLTASVITALNAQLASAETHVVANGLVLLAFHKQADVVRVALKLAT